MVKMGLGVLDDDPVCCTAACLSFLLHQRSATLFPEFLQEQQIGHRSRCDLSLRTLYKVLNRNGLTRSHKYVVGYSKIDGGWGAKRLPLQGSVLHG